ncbi:MAG: LOG family protein [Nanoarchaeota archaeon]|nr:LOG family protein [Nanoarchaeota archaeon]
MRKAIAVIGSASETNNQAINLAREVGIEIAKRGYTLITGACPYLPYEAAKAAKQEGGFVIGISPASNYDEHINGYGFPDDVFDFIVYTGFGLKGRNVIMIRSADAVVAISGRIGTLNELTIAYDELKPIGILDVEGLAIEFPELVKKSKKKGSRIIVEKSPEKLLMNLSKLIEQ